MQELLVSISFLAALSYIVWFIYSHYFSSKKKCDGCVVNKLYQAKIEKSKS